MARERMLKIPVKSLKSHLERVKGIEPSYSAWKSRKTAVFSEAVLTLFNFLTPLDHYGISLCQNGDYHQSVHSLQLSNCGAQGSLSIPPLYVLATADPACDRAD
jgi:hypothetical protein